MEYKDIVKAIDVLNWIIEQTENGDRDGWGYDLYSFKQTVSCLYNEQRMKGEEL